MMPVPGRCQALGDEDVTQGFAIAHYAAQLAAILVLVTITARDDLERSFVEKINKSMGGLYSACQLVGAFVIVHFRRIDIDKPDFGAVDPDRVAIDYAGDADHTPAQADVRGDKFGGEDFVLLTLSPKPDQSPEVAIIIAPAIQPDSCRRQNLLKKLLITDPSRGPSGRLR
jgi:hypothetical protein